MPNLSDLSALRWQAALADLIPSAAHQINGPLTALLGYVELLTSPQESSSADRSENLRRLMAEAQRCADLVHRLHLLARPPSTDRPRRALIQDAVQSVHLLAASRLQRAHVLLVTQDIEVLPLPSCDSGYVERAILGLLNCACGTAKLRAASPAAPVTLELSGRCTGLEITLEATLISASGDNPAQAVPWCAESVDSLREDLLVLGVRLEPEGASEVLRMRLTS